MNVLIISTNRNQFPMPVIPLGACMVAEAAARAGHRARLVDVMFEDDPVVAVRRELEKEKPDVVGLSIRNIDNNDCSYPEFFIRELPPLIGAARDLTSAPLVLGGAAVSVMPEELLRFTGAEWAVLGDGETVFPQFLGELADGCPKTLEGVAWLEEETFYSNHFRSRQDRCSCDLPDFHRYIDVTAYLRRLSTGPVQTKLGCQFSCVYCTYRKIEGGSYRLGDPEEVAANIGRLVSKGFRNIELVDNVFNAPYSHALAICHELIRTRSQASLQSLELNPLFIDDDLISSMERAGFSGIGITVESASDAVLEGLGKGFSAEHVYKAAQVVGRHDLPCVWIFMMGGPNETRGTVRETLRFAETVIRPKDAAFFGMGIRTYPGTELDLIARKQGLLSLTPAEMLEPVFYISPTVDYGWMLKQVKNSMNEHMNFMNSESLGMRLLPAIHRLAYMMGVRSPLWRHTSAIRRGLRLLGMEV
ncbi:MAG: cobalamin-dependent protein [Candidatus Sulfobium sp.]|jgi:radical SAM superfamily enzyme YgiQ (UPF0313 family)